MSKNQPTTFNVHLPDNLPENTTRWEGDYKYYDQWEVWSHFHGEHEWIEVRTTERSRSVNVFIDGSIEQLEQLGQSIINQCKHERERRRDEQNARDAFAIEDRAMAEVE